MRCRAAHGRITARSGPENGPQGLHRPRTRFKLLWDDNYLAVCWEVQDQYVRAQYSQYQDGAPPARARRHLRHPTPPHSTPPLRASGVCRDSCCELFIAPSEDSDDRTPFFNFEVNAGGTMLLYHCTRVNGHEGNREVSQADAATVKMASSLVQPGNTLAWGPGRVIEPEVTGPTT